MYNLYEPKKEIYIIKNNGRRIVQVIGSKQDLPIMNSIAMMDATRTLKNSDIQEAISEHKEDFKKLRRED